MPEAFSEAEELVSEISRCHPEWLLKAPTAEGFDRNYWDWKRPRGGFWDRARTGADELSEQIEELEHEDVEKAQGEAKAGRNASEKARWLFDKVALDRISARITGNDGGALEPWRIEGKNYLVSVLRSPKPHPMKDWVTPLLDLRCINSQVEIWQHFWFTEIRSDLMPRWWLRWATRLLASLRTVSSGTPFDIQLSTHLVEATHIVTADKIFSEIVDVCRRTCSRPLAQPILVPGGGDAVLALLDFLGEV